MLVHYLLAAASAVVTFLWLKSLPWSIFSASISVFLDLDHLFDFWRARGFTIDARKFIAETRDGGKYFEDAGKIFILLHSWELLILVWAVAIIVNHPCLGISFSLGFVPHLLWDQVTVAKKPLMYSFIFRVLNHFDLGKICGNDKMIS